MYRKMFSILLALAVVLCVSPTAVMAEGGDHPLPQSVVNIMPSKGGELNGSLTYFGDSLSQSQGSASFWANSTTPVSSGEYEATAEYSFMAQIYRDDLYKYMEAAQKAKFADDTQTLSERSDPSTFKATDVNAGFIVLNNKFYDGEFVGLSGTGYYSIQVHSAASSGDIEKFVKDVAAVTLALSQEINGKAPKPERQQLFQAARPGLYPERNREAVFGRL